MKLIEKFSSRGIGSEWGLPCFASGQEFDRGDLNPNISGFVESKEAGENVVAMFNDLAYLDFRPFEPNWVQVKVGTSEANVAALEKLHELVRENGNLISREIIEKAKLVLQEAPETP